MKVIKPVALSDALFVSSTAPEADYAVYVPATNYAVGNRVIYNHVVYESVQTPNTGNTPGLFPLFWAVVSPTNRWAMFDSEVSTQTALASPLTVVIKPGYVNSLALFGLEGTQLAVTMRDGAAGPVVYSKTVSLDGTIIADWYQYFYEPSVQKGEAVLTDLPPYADGHITVSITGGGTVKCGTLLVGTVYPLGDTQYGAQAGILDFSRKDTNATTGVTTFTKRKFSKRMSASMMLDNGQLNKVQRVLADLRATPCAYIGTDFEGYEPLTIFGFYRDFSLDIAYPTTSLFSLEIEGLA
jgi:hypothetical protein